MDRNMEIKMEESFELLFIMLKTRIDDDGQHLKEFVVEHSHRLLPDYVDTLLEAISEKANGYQQDKFIMLRELLSDCREHGIDKAFEIYKYTQDATWLNIMRFAEEASTIDEKENMVHRFSSTLLSALAVVMIRDFIESSREIGFPDEILDLYRFNMGVLIHCRQVGVDRAFNELRMA
jgi:hypothetical protein